MKRLPVVRLVAIGIGAVLLVAGYALWQNQQTENISRLFSQNQEIQRLRMEMREHLKVLELAVRMGAFSGQESWENIFQQEIGEYFNFEKESVASQLNLGNSAELRQSLENFQRLAERIFASVRDRNLQQARKISESLDFETAIEDLHESIKQSDQYFVKQYNQGTLEIQKSLQPLKWFMVVIIFSILTLVISGAQAISNWHNAIQDLNANLANLVEKKTEEIRSQSEQLLMASKLATMGEISASIGHEINNPLAVILGKISMVEKRIQGTPQIQDLEIHDDLKKIRQMGERISKIVRGLKSMSRQESSEVRSPSKLSEILETVLVLQEGHIKQSQVELKLNDLPDVTLLCNETQIGQVLTNLIGNAIDAVTGSAGAWAELSFSLQPQFFEISITDSGKGIPVECREKIFSSFFTTKEKGKGTGLGLPLSRKIMQSHGGDLVLDANHSHTRFILKFPRAMIS